MIKDEVDRGTYGGRKAIGEMEGVGGNTRLGKGNVHNISVKPYMRDRGSPEDYSSHAKRLLEIKMGRWACGHLLRDKPRNNNIRERLIVENTTERCSKPKARLSWFAHRQTMN